MPPLNTQQQPPMRLIALNDRVASIDVVSIGIDKIKGVLTTLPPERWKEAAAGLPKEFVAEICKQGTVEELKQYVPDMIGGMVGGITVGVITKNVWYGIGAGIASFFITGAVRKAV
ncbi:MAG: hypothetical protein JNL32_00255 [Candidatus Kapabacteria bacterium]|nr:hypothetical protein [Candidatus Kapabacteria bacterium]